MPHLSRVLRRCGMVLLSVSLCHVYECHDWLTWIPEWRLPVKQGYTQTTLKVKQLTVNYKRHLDWYTPPASGHHITLPLSLHLRRDWPLWTAPLWLGLNPFCPCPCLRLWDWYVLIKFWDRKFHYRLKRILKCSLWNLMLYFKLFYFSSEWRQPRGVSYIIALLTVLATLCTFNYSIITHTYHPV